MKKLLLLLVASLTMLFWGCTQFDDSRIWDAIDELEDLYDDMDGRVEDLDGRVEDLEEACEKMNTNIEALQTLVSALQNNDTITSIAPIKQGDKVVGYTITFSKSEPITIYHGNDGKDGANGADGKDGKDGYTPQIGVAKDSDNVYYWTLDGEWLLDESGNKIRAVGTDGKDGADGANGSDGTNGEDGKDGENGADGKDGEDGITPQLEIREGYWWISHDNGATWKELGKATGEDGKDGANGSDGQDGKDGADGDSLFESVTWDEEYAYFTLSDGTVITISLSDGAVTKTVEITAVALLGSVDHGMLGFALSDVGFNLEDTSEGGIFLPNSRNHILTLTVDIDDYSVVPQGTFTSEAGDFETRDGCFCMFVGEDDQESFNISEAVVVVSEGRIEATLTLDNGEVHHVVYEGSLKIGERIEDDPDVPNTEIYYTSTDGKIVGPSSDAFGVNILSNTYEDGKGVIIIDGDAVEIGEDAFSGCSNLASLIIPEGVTSIGAWAFNACENLTSINIPDGITSIEQSTFRFCSSLTSINIPDGVTEIGDRAFEDCSRLASLTIPEGVTSIGQHAFYYCCSLTSITIPESVVSIKYGAFQCCSSLTEVYCKPTTPPSGGGYMFHNDVYALECTIYVPTESVSAYKSASYWSNYADSIVGYDFE